MCGSRARWNSCKLADDGRDIAEGCCRGSSSLQCCRQLAGFRCVVASRLHDCHGLTAAALRLASFQASPPALHAAGMRWGLSRRVSFDEVLAERTSESFVEEHVRTRLIRSCGS